MNNFQIFKKKSAEDNLSTLRGNFLDNYTFIEKYCKKKYGKSGNYLDLLAQNLNLLEGNEQKVIELIKQDYIKSNSLDYSVSTKQVMEATNFLRRELLNEKNESTYQKDSTRAMFVLLQQIRDNLSHDGKTEIDTEQYQRNYTLIRIASELSDSTIEKLNI